MLPQTAWSDEQVNGNDSEFIVEEESDQEALADELFGDDETESSQYQFSDADDFQVKTIPRGEYRLTVASSTSEKGYKTSDDDKDKTEELIGTNLVNMQFFINTSPETKYYLDLYATFERTYDQDKDNSDEESDFDDQFSFYIKEAFADHQAGRHFFKIGKQEIDISKLVFKIGNTDMGDEAAFSPLGVFETGDRKPFSFKYLWAPIINHSITLYYSPFYIRTNKEQDSIDQAKSDAAVAEIIGNMETNTPLRDHYGVMYKFSTDMIDLEIGAFRWFDKENFRYASVLTPSIDGSSDTFLEREDQVEFATLSFGLTSGDYDWKLEAIHSPEKNFYSISREYKPLAVPPHLESKFQTYRLPYTSIALGVEKRWPEFYLMPVIRHSRIEEVPADVQLYLYENEEEPKTEEHIVEKNEFFLLLFSGLPSKETGWPGNMIFLASYYQSYPIKTTAGVFIAKWIPLNSNTEFIFTWKNEETEKLYATNQAIKKSYASLSVAYLW